MAETSVDDFSEQWSRYDRQDGYFVSRELLDDILCPFVRVEDARGRDVCEIGCGNGRFVKLFAAVARRVVGVDPSEGIHNARKLCAGDANVELLQRDAFDLPPLDPFDLVVSIGVVHHTPDPLATLRVMRGLLKDGGKAVLWVYGREGNELYLATFGALRAVTQRLPDPALHALATALTPPLWGYIRACRALPLP